MAAGSAVLGLRPVADPADVFESERVGLDHLSFAVESRAALEAARADFAERGLTHGEIKEWPVRGRHPLRERPGRNPPRSHRPRPGLIPRLTLVLRAGRGDHFPGRRELAGPRTIGASRWERAMDGEHASRPPAGNPDRHFVTSVGASGGPGRLTAPARVEGCRRRTQGTQRTLERAGVTGWSFSAAPSGPTTGSTPASTASSPSRRPPIGPSRAARAVRAARPHAQRHVRGHVQSRSSCSTAARSSCWTTRNCARCSGTSWAT
jgi:hypothetical protein